jgi:hypothetical protein
MNVTEQSLCSAKASNSWWSAVKIVPPTRLASVIKKLSASETRRWIALNAPAACQKATSISHRFERVRRPNRSVEIIEHFKEIQYMRNTSVVPVDQRSFYLLRTCFVPR